MSADVSPSEQAVLRPLSDKAQKARRALLINTTILAAVVFGGVLPTEIAQFGVTFQATETAALYLLIYSAQTYFLLAFVLYSRVEGVAWRRAFQDFRGAAVPLFEGRRDGIAAALRASNISDAASQAAQACADLRRVAPLGESAVLEPALRACEALDRLGASWRILSEERQQELKRWLRLSFRSEFARTAYSPWQEIVSAANARLDAVLGAVANEERELGRTRYTRRIERYRKRLECYDPVLHADVSSSEAVTATAAAHQYLANISHSRWIEDWTAPDDVADLLQSIDSPESDIQNTYTAPVELELLRKGLQAPNCLDALSTVISNTLIQYDAFGWFEFRLPIVLGGSVLIAALMKVVVPLIAA